MKQVVETDEARALKKGVNHVRPIPTDKVIKGSIGDICQIDIADSGALIPAEHRIDGLRQLGGAGLVDAASTLLSIAPNNSHEAGKLTCQSKPTGVHLGEPACNNSRSSDTQVSP
jgi:hypothetical protein